MTGVKRLYNACYAGKLDKVKQLVEENDVDINAVFGKDSSPPLIGAIYGGHIEVVRYLLNCDGCDIERTEYHGETPPFKACRESTIDMVSLLIEYGTKVSSPSNVGYTLLWDASFNCEKDNVNKLLEHNVEANQTSKDGRSPM